MNGVSWVVLKLMLLNILIQPVQGTEYFIMSWCESSEWEECLIHWMAGFPFTEPWQAKDRVQQKPSSSGKTKNPSIWDGINLWNITVYQAGKCTPVKDCVALVVKHLHQWKLNAYCDSSSGVSESIIPSSLIISGHIYDTVPVIVLSYTKERLTSFRKSNI